MSVLLPNAHLGVRRRATEGRNAHGERVPAGWGSLVQVLDGRVSEDPQAGWALALDPALWPVRMHDLVVGMDGASWVVQTADLITNNYDPTVDYIAVTAARRSQGGTEPGGAWFVARYTDTVDAGDPGGADGPVVVQAGLWTGEGPPPAGDWGAKPGDEYVDLVTGNVYRLGPQEVLA